MEGVNSAKARSGLPSQVADPAHSDENFVPSTYNSPAASPICAQGVLPSNVRHADHMSIPSCPAFRPAEYEVLETAAQLLLPPVTRSTLRELDLNWIMHNISLRVDVNYDHDLHFMPIQGPDGEHKRQDAKKYWLALAIEFRIYQHNLTKCPFCERVAEASPGAFRPRLPSMFEALRELLETLVPDRDHPEIAENLDIPLLVQQVRKGVLDIVRLSQWIADLLKSHCAPMRDEWADTMAATIEEGCRTADMDIIVDGLEKLFSFLEAMKLDVANHQIRTFRYPLIEDTVSFQQGYFSRKLQDGRIDAEASRKWYRQARDDHHKCQSSAGHPSAVERVGDLIHGILRHCTQAKRMSMLPDTLAYDRLRIGQLQDDVQDIIHLHRCVQVFNLLCPHPRPRSVGPNAAVATLQCRLRTIIENDDSESRRESWLAQINDVAMEIARAASVERGSDDVRIPDHEFKRTTRDLEQAFTYDSGSLANDLHTKLEERTVAYARTFQKQSPLQISEAQKHWQQSRQERKLWRADVEDMARRLAHIAVLHWKIWADLVYMNGEDEDAANRGSIAYNGNRPNHLHQIPLSSRELIPTEPDWTTTPPIDKISTMNKK